MDKLPTDCWRIEIFHGAIGIGIFLNSMVEKEIMSWSMSPPQVRLLTYHKGLQMGFVSRTPSGQKMAENSGPKVIAAVVLNGDEMAG